MATPSYIKMKCNSHFNISLVFLLDGDFAAIILL